MATPPNVTELLRRWKIDGDHEAEEQLFVVVEAELRAIAARALRREGGLGHKIDPRELVSEAYLRLREYAIDTPNRAPFFHLMAKAMRQCLLDLARRDAAEKRPPSRLRVVDSGVMNSVTIPSDVGPIDFYESLDALTALNRRQGEIIELRVIGLNNDEIAREQRVSVATVKREVAEARAFLAFRLGLPSDWIHT